MEEQKYDEINVFADDMGQKGPPGWRHGLFACLGDPFSCVLTAICCPLQLANTKTRFDDTSLAMNICVACCAPCFASVVFRNEVRIGYGLAGTWLSDIALGCLCPWLSTCQLSKEVTARGSVVTESLVME